MPADLPTSQARLDPQDLTYRPWFTDPPSRGECAVNSEIAFRHSGWLNDRRRVYDALEIIDRFSKRADRFRYCGSDAWVVYDEANPDHVAVVSSHCHDRFCRPCSRFKAHTVAANLSAYLGNRPYRFLTLTIKNTGLTLQQGLDKLYHAFARLRRTRFWNSRVVGGCAVCEVKPSSGGTRWHPHLHCIIEGKYLPKAVLESKWLEITGDSYICDIKLGTDSANAARYVAKYITKPFDDDTIRRPHRLTEAIKALTGRRTVTTFGSWRGVKLTVYEPTTTWVKLCSLSSVIFKAQSGDPEARHLLALLSDDEQLLELPTPEPRPPPEPPGDRQWTLPKFNGSRPCYAK